MAGARELARSAESLLLPAACLGCERPLRPIQEAAMLCDGCRLRQAPIAPPVCARCGQPADRWDPGTAGGCGFCRSWPPALAWARSAVWMDEGPARALVHALKYDGWRCAGRPMAQALARLGGMPGPATALVPIPLGRGRLRERGHNQALVLAEALSALTGAPVARDVLVRHRETRSQTALDPAGRRRNVAGAFSARPGDGRPGLVLVDDVLTTGATLIAAAEALQAAGAAPVGALTFARAAQPGRRG